MKYWIAAAVLMALACIAALAVCIRQRKQIQQNDADLQQLRIELDGIRRENIDFRREIAALNRDIEEEQRYSDRLTEELDNQYRLLMDAEERVTRAENRRTDAEKEIYAGRMRAEQLQQQLRQAHLEQMTQEQLYQDIIRDRDATIAQLQERSVKLRPKKKKDVLDQQITLDDILGGGNA